MKGTQCDKCGADHPRNECKFEGECNKCHKKGHKANVCKSKTTLPKVRASMAVETSDEPFVSIRCAIVTDGDKNTMKIQPGTLGATSGATSKMSDDHLTTVQERGSEYICSTNVTASVLTDGDVRAAPAICERDGQSYTRWCVDSGANRDICNEYDLFGMEPTPKVIRIGEAGKGHAFNSKAEGIISIKTKGNELPLFKKVIYADQVNENIMSVAEAVDQGFTAVFTKNGVQLHWEADVETKNPILIGGRDPKTRLFYFDLPRKKETKVDVKVAHLNEATGQGKGNPMRMTDKSGQGPLSFKTRRSARQKLTEELDPPCDVKINLSRTYNEYHNDYELWHPRLAHINQKLAKLAKPDLKDWPVKAHCDGCIMGKIHKFPHSGKRPIPEEMPWKVGEYWTCDLFGPLLRSMGGAVYAAFYTDVKSKFTYVKPLSDKTGHYQAFVEVITDAKARSGRPIRFFKTDSDGIFVGEQNERLMIKYGIRHLQSAPGDSASNDVAERTIRTFAELTRTNLLHANAPPSLWAEAMKMVEYVWNRIPVLPNPKDPSTKISRLALHEGHERSYDMSIFRAFGTKCHFLLTLQKKGGLKMAVQTKGRLGAIIGVEDNMPAYRVLEIPARAVRVIPFVQLVSHEGHYPFRDTKVWKDEEKALPISFMPSREAELDADEWTRYDFAKKHIDELEMEYPIPILMKPTVKEIVPDKIPMEIDVDSDVDAGDKEEEPSKRYTGRTI